MGQLAVETERLMLAQTAGLKTKSDKIRTLGKGGYTRQQIADFLGIKYQFVRNVLVDEARRQRGGFVPSDAIPPDLEIKSVEQKDTVKVKLGPGGQLTIPAHMRQTLALKDGDTVWLTLEDGEVRLADARAITKRVQAAVRKFVPEGVSLVDELLAERKREFEREMRGE
jgi:AbrB family looped-hinge helix DNA binding protein